MKSAVEQFVNDWLVVVENDYEAYTEVMETVRPLRGDVYTLSQKLREEWETYVDQVAQVWAEKFGFDSIGELLIRQIMGSWGDDAWWNIAKYLIDHDRNQQEWLEEQKSREKTGS